MPGVSVTTATRSGPTPAARTPSGQYFVVGLTDHGSTTAAIEVRGMADALTALGDRVSYGSLHDSLKSYFDEGGERAYVARIVGGSATKGTHTFADRAGSPISTIRVDAANAGAWSSNLKVQITNGSLADTFRLIVTLSGAVVQTETNIATPAEAVTRFSDSEYIRVVDLASATAAPNNNPAVIAATSLSAGDDDRASLAADDYVTGLDLFIAELGDGAVAIPGQTDTDIWEGIQTHCEANNRIGLLVAASSADESDLLDRASEIDSEFCGLFAPWVIVSDGSGGRRTVSPEGYVAGVRARAHEQVGPWRVPAGQIAVAESLLDLETRFTATEANSLNDGRVSAIRALAGTFRLYGWRSLSSDEDNYRHLKDRDLLNYLTVQAQELLEKYVFEPIDAKGQLLSLINGELVGMCMSIAAANGLYARINDAGDEVDPGYVVDTGPNVNSTASLAQNKVAAKLSVRISPVGELIELKIVKVDLLSSVS